jgi:hypothetical protein
MIWPRTGSCGACGRPAREFPSGNWEHVGVPCLARSQGAWRIDDIYIKKACRFVPEGEPLPVEPDKWHMHETEWTAEGFPIQLAICNSNHMHSVREYLAAEAESREVAHG